MAERSFFFDGEDKLYNSQDFAQLFDMFFGTGVVKGYLHNMNIISISDGMKTSVNSGCAVIYGRGYILEGLRILVHDPAHATLDRIDRIVLQLNLATRSINLIVKKGAVAALPVPPTLQQDNMNNGGIIYELPIAQVRIIKGKSFIDGTQITDERTFCDLQGQTGLYAKKKQSSWVVPEFRNGWTPARKDGMVSYFLDDFGVIHFRGAVMSGYKDNGMVILQIPSDLAPLEPQYRPVTTIDNNGWFAIGHVVMWSDGQLICKSIPVNREVDISTISYPTKYAHQ
ncbi:structural protein [Bacillus tropicus]|uniref:structural protein n=1 Tax=Bacillus cereus group TaxID=86661 RepID=UPI002405266C|nr:MULTISPECIES: structural protein [Bacillus cereus group]MDF9623651.1 structural protein [Bacillus cereus]MEC2551490.1 structural protein [Bacillus tropicus]